MTYSQKNKLIVTDRHLNTLTRKQREIADRHELFLQIARELIHEEGFHQLTMERVAEIAEYSKGTVYQHFSCKEEILIQLCNSCMTSTLKLFERAATFDGSHRERIMAVFCAHGIWNSLYPNDMPMMQNLHTDGVINKVTPTSAVRHDELEKQILGTVSKIVQDAIDDGDLKNEDLNAIEVVFGLWAANYGGQMISSFDLPLQELGVRDNNMVLARIAIAILDGLDWQPKQSFKEFPALIERIQTQLFADEMALIASQASNSKIAKEST